jgi:hypothetical protein
MVDFGIPMMPAGRDPFQDAMRTCARARRRGPVVDPAVASRCSAIADRTHGDVRTWRRSSPSPPAGSGLGRPGAASGVLDSTRQIGASLGLAVLGTAAGRTGHATTVGALDCGCALRMLVGAGVLVLAVLVRDLRAA